jgi:4-aminobutyrate aminotransferase
MLTIRDSQNQEGADDWIGPAPEIKIPPPGPKAFNALNRYREFTSSSHVRLYPLAAARARGSVIEDLDGNRFLDFAAGIAVCSTGHCHPKVVSAIQRQAAELMHLWGCGFCYDSQVQLLDKLRTIAPGDEPKKVFLGNSGTEGIEAAIKLARWYTKRPWIISFFGAFHGRSMGSLSLTCSKIRQREGFGPLLPAVAHAPFGDADFIENYLFKHAVPPTEVAAIVVEPIQGEGGYIVAEDDFLKRLREICDRHTICLVADEIQSGIGRTGKWWAVDHAGVVPDILVAAKGIASGMPLSAVIAPERIMSWPEGAHGTTFGGNPVCCAAAVATLELVEKQYLANVAALSEVAFAKLSEMRARYSCVDGPRGRGLMLAVGVVEDKRKRKPAPELRNKICQEAFRRGLVLMPAGEAAIRIVPPLCINRVQLEVGLKVLAEAVATVAG